MPHDLVFDRALVSMARLILDVTVDQRVLREHFAHEEFLGQGEGLNNIGDGDMDELSLCVAAKIVVSEEGVGANLVSDVVGLLLERLLVGVVPDTNSALQDKVHLKNLFLFVVDHILFLLVAEVARLQAESHIVEELAILVLLRVKEETEVIENVVEKVVHDDTTLNLAGQGIDELIVFLDLAESVVCPEILEVLINLAVKRVRQRLVTEARQQSHPVVQVKGLLLVAQVLVESRDDLDEATHDVREEGHAAKHDKYAKYHLGVRLGVKITVAHRGQSRDREVAGRDHLIVTGRVFQMVLPNEVRLVWVVKEARPKVEDQTNEVGDDDGEQDQAEHAVDVLHD